MAELTFHVEQVETSWDEMVKLAETHWKETQAYRHGQPFNPKKERYAEYERIGCFIQFTARDGDRMVGYGGAYVVPSMHTQEVIATEDTWFLLPEYRKGFNAVRFFRFMEEECRKRGAVDVTLTVPHGIGTGVLCKRLGYSEVATVWNKQFKTGLAGEAAAD